ncbi:MAG: DUF2938 family protein [Chitinophagaceae bacterium]|nr:DUF2938 family protein [Chitinophagaceae bacterium]MBP8669643.1 DUF2938 family protein [Bacteroidia bacterium]MBP9104524.1 DUF2938 family protein [Chitinophagaceae bacterium]
MNTQLAMKSGLLATAAMTALMLMAPMMGMPEMPIGKMLAEFMNIPVVLGWVMHVMIGVGLAVGYILFFRDKISAPPAVKGMLFGMIPFLMAQLVVMPMMGMGVFTSAAGPMQMKMIMGSLMGHLIYGLVLGLTAEEKKVTAMGS